MHVCKIWDNDLTEYQFWYKPEAYNPEAYNFVAMLGFFREPIKTYFLLWNYW